VAHELRLNEHEIRLQCLKLWTAAIYRKRMLGMEKTGKKRRTQWIQTQYQWLEL